MLQVLPQQPLPPRLTLKPAPISTSTHFTLTKPSLLLQTVAFRSHNSRFHATVPLFYQEFTAQIKTNNATYSISQRGTIYEINSEQMRFSIHPRAGIKKAFSVDGRSYAWIPKSQGFDLVNYESGKIIAMFRGQFLAFFGDFGKLVICDDSLTDIIIVSLFCVLEQAKRDFLRKV